jgi:hypothetical protein
MENGINFLNCQSTTAGIIKMIEKAKLVGLPLAPSTSSGLLGVEILFFGVL